MFGVDNEASRLTAEMSHHRPASPLSILRHQRRDSAIDSGGHENSPTDDDCHTLRKWKDFSDRPTEYGQRYERRRPNLPETSPEKPVSPQQWPSQHRFGTWRRYIRGSEYTELLSHNMALQKDLQKAKDQSEERRDEVKRLTDEKDKMKRAADKLQVFMAGKDDLFANQPPDDIVLGSMISLLGQIKGWSTHFLRADNVGQAMLREDDLVHYRAVFPGARCLESLHGQFQDRKRRRLFVRAWTAYVICDAVFSAPRHEYQRRASCHHIVEPAYDCAVERILALEDMMRSMKVPPGRLNDWRALTFHLLPIPEDGSNFEESVPPWLLEECTRVLSAIAPWIKPGQPLPEVIQQLLTIFQHALKISALLRRQRARWSIGFPGVQGSGASDVLHFDEACMKTDYCGEASTPKTVELVLTPAVYKEGNAEGEFFHVKTCLQKATVI